MKKELLISAKMQFDNAEFDRSIEQMQKKLKQLYAPSDMIRQQTLTNQRLQSVGAPGLSGAGHEAFAKATMASKRELDTLIRQEVKSQNDLVKMISERKSLSDKLASSQANLVKGSQEELKIAETIQRVKENTYRKEEEYKKKDQQLNQLMDARNKSAPRDIPGLMDAYRNGGAMHAMKQIPGAFRQNPLGMGGSALTGIGSLLMGGSEIYDQYSRMPIKTEANRGRAAQGLLGQDTRNVYSGRSAFENNFGDERAKAAQMALDRLQDTKMVDRTQLAGSAALIAGGGMASATGVGAIGGLGAVAGGAFGMLRNGGRLGALAMSPFSKRANNYYNSTLAGEAADNYSSTYQNLKDQNPLKTEAINNYEQNFQRDIGFQRGTGMNNQQFRGAGGFLQGVNNAGFTGDMGVAAGNSILGAGGSSRSAAGNSAFALQAERGLGLTNATSILGNLSGSIGTSQGSSQATIKILAEGMKLGLDDSKFAEENRRFTQVAADIISKSGATGDKDFQRVAGKFGDFMGENTNAGVTAAKTAYDQYQQQSSTTTGPRGTMRAAGFLADKDLSKLSTIQKQSLMQIPEDQLNENNIMVQGAAAQLGIDPSKIVDKIKGVNEGSVSRFQEADTLRDKLRGKMKGMGINKITEENMKSMPKDMQKDIFNLTSFQNTESGYLGSKETVSRVNGILGQGGTPSDVQKDRESVLQSRMQNPTGQIEDKTITQMAKDSSVVLANFNDMAPAMGKAAENAASLTRSVIEMNAALIKALEDARSGNNKDLSAVEKLLRDRANSNKNQHQSGKRSQ